MKPTTEENYSTSGFNSFLRKESPAIARDVEPQRKDEKMEDEVSIKTPQISSDIIIKEIKKEILEFSVGELVQLTAISGIGGSIGVVLGNGSQATLSTTIVDAKNPSRKMLGVCEITAYQDTLGGTTSRIPHNISLSKYSIYTAFDYEGNQESARPNQGLTYYYIIRNTSGATHTIWWYLRYRYFGPATTIE